MTIEKTTMATETRITLRASQGLIHTPVMTHTPEETRTAAQTRTLDAHLLGRWLDFTIPICVQCTFTEVTTASPHL